jgi:hypothetical protein
MVLVDIEAEAGKMASMLKPGESTGTLLPFGHAASNTTARQSQN